MSRLIFVFHSFFFPFSFITFYFSILFFLIFFIAFIYLLIYIFGVEGVKTKRGLLGVPTGGIFSKWKQRWVVLANDSLSVYKHEEDEERQVLPLFLFVNQNNLSKQVTLCVSSSLSFFFLLQGANSFERLIQAFWEPVTLFCARLCFASSTCLFSVWFVVLLDCERLVHLHTTTAPLWY